jgi:predicted aspartyl protease
LIGEIDPEFVRIEDTPKIPTFPESNPNRWNVLIDAIMVGQNVTIPTSKIAGAPSGKAVGLLDTGTSYTYVPTEIAQAIYGSVSGATYDTATGYWKVPCNVEVDVAIQIGSVKQFLLLAVKHYLTLF